MKVQTITKRIASVALLAALGVSFNAAADDSIGDSLCHRPGAITLYPFGQFLFGDHIKNSIGPGVGVGYNLCEQAAITVEGYVGDLDTHINGINGVGTTYDVTLNFEYKFLKGKKFSPYLVAGAGVFNYDSKDHDPHPVLLNVADTGVMFGGGPGVSYEFNKHWFFKGCFRVWGTTVRNANVLYGPTLAAGYSF